MNKKLLIIVLGISLAIIGGAVYLLVSSDDKTAMQAMRDEKAAKSSANAQVDKEANSSNEAGRYIEYTPSAIAETSGTKLLFFHAAWCPQCRKLEADIKSKTIPAGVTIMKVDYDTNQPLRQKYGVTLQTTIVKLDDTGELVKKFVAYDDPSLKAIEDNLLN